MLNKSIPFSNKLTAIACAPTMKHCSKGPKSSASISTLDAMAIDQGIKTTVEVWDQREKKMYVFDAKVVLKKLYFCGASEYMVFQFKQIIPLEVI